MSWKERLKSIPEFVQTWGLLPLSVNQKVFPKERYPSGQAQGRPAVGYAYANQAYIV
ncbi:MAG: hypothetical protein ACYTXY_08670 [Nostoc sp.]